MVFIGLKKAFDRDGLQKTERIWWKKSVELRADLCLSPKVHVFKSIIYIEQLNVDSK